MTLFSKNINILDLILLEAPAGCEYTVVVSQEDENNLIDGSNYFLNKKYKNKISPLHLNRTHVCRAP